jgi:hypothetical protein
VLRRRVDHDDDRTSERHDRYHRARGSRSQRHDQALRAKSAVADAQQPPESPPPPVAAARFDAARFEEARFEPLSHSEELLFPSERRL